MRALTLTRMNIEKPLCFHSLPEYLHTLGVWERE